MIRNWFFDLDGTLARTGEDIRLAWRGALTACGCDLTHFDEVFTIGPSFDSVIRELYPDAPATLAAEVLAAFRPIYDNGGFPNTEPYAGVEELLSTLKARGARLYIVTNKRHAATQRLVDRLGWRDVFDGVWSYDTFETKYKKPELLAHLVGTLGFLPSESVMVGDTKGDIDAGRANGFATIGVTYGYGSRDELRDADVLFDTPLVIANFTGK